MTTLPSDIPSFEGGANITPGVKSGNNKTLKELFESTRNDLIALETDVNAIPEMARYVDNQAPAGGDGSLLKPYDTIQAAIDDIEANVSAPNPFEYGIVYIRPGKPYDEGIRILKDGVKITLYGLGDDSVFIAPTSGVSPVIVSNATPASITTWESSHNYADLAARAPAEKGPDTVVLVNIGMFCFFSSLTNVHGISILGVPGDATGTTTEFLLACYLYNIDSGAKGSGKGLYARNANCTIAFHGGGVTGGADVLQCRSVLVGGKYPSKIRGNLNVVHDTADAQGCCDGAPFSSNIRRNSSVQSCTVGDNIELDIYNNAIIEGELELNSDSVVEASNAYIGGALDINGDGAHGFKGVTVAGDADIVAAGNLDAKGCKFLGDFTAAAGAGVIDLHDSTIAGAITDPGYRVARDLVPTHKRYVDLYAAAGGDGSFDKPYTAIQDAIDALENEHTAGAVSIVEVLSGNNASFDENLLITKDGLDLTIIGHGAIVLPTAGDALTITNATLASLATWQSSRTYSDLVAKATPEAGPLTVKFRDISFSAYGAGAYGCSFVGVAGDDTVSTTKFLWYGMTFVNTVVGGDLKSLYCRNAGALSLENCRFQRVLDHLQSASIVTIDGVAWLQGGLNMVYDAADPQGTSFGHYSSSVAAMRFSSKVTVGEGVTLPLIGCHFEGELEVNDDGIVQIENSYIGGSLDINGDGAHVFKGVTVAGNADLVAAGNLDAKGCRFLGDFTAAAGAGVVELKDSPVLGEISDAGDKIVHSRAGVRAGVVTAAGAGDEVVAFASTLGTTQYVITITQEDDGTGLTTYMVKSGTKAATGFTMTVGGAGIFYWKAEVLTQ
jgi:hypothetical protein